MERNMICMRLVRNFLAGMLLTGMLALAPDISFARGGGGGGHFEGGGHFAGVHGGGFASRGFGRVAHGFHGPIAAPGRGEYHGSAWRHSFHGYYGYYVPFDYGLGDYAYPYYDNDESFDAQAVPGDGGSVALAKSVQKELAKLGYYHGAIDGIAGSETENAIRWFQSVDHLSVTGQIDDQTLQALGVA
jgi:hypothetical protein